MDGTAKTGTTDASRDAPAERRQHARVGTMWMATLSSIHGLFDCMVIDISRGGAKLMLTEPHTLGGTVTLTLEAFGKFRANPVWQRGEFAGIRFLDPPETIAASLQGMVP